MTTLWHKMIEPLRPREPRGKPIMFSTMLRGRDLTVYGRGAYDITATRDEVVINGHRVTDRDLDRGWFDAEPLAR